MALNPINRYLGKPFQSTLPPEHCMIGVQGDHISPMDSREHYSTFMIF